MTPTLETIEGNPAANASIRELGTSSSMMVGQICHTIYKTH